ncbi:unnamed protein product [Ambrosiozyma monospora]|uniref:Unnamed protein product n=1 Tax=Ambrosiozyma monospora TaxID=43982 RepID=A0ACB5T528_AMBMO|nr:unnamed protein product [Ambrosiozyma monospora]
MSSNEAIFRSADMTLVQFYIASEISRDCVAVLGELGNVQFRDLNESVNAFQRAFVKEIRKFDDAERQLRYLESILNKQEVAIPVTSYDYLITPPRSELSAISNATSTPSRMDDVINIISTYENNIRHLSETYDDLKSRYLDLLEHRTVLQGTRKFFDQRLSLELDSQSPSGFRRSLDETEGLLTEEDALESGLFAQEPDRSNNNSSEGNQMNVLGSTMNFICGIIESDKFLTLQKILHRTLRGNLYLNHLPIEQPIVDPKTGEEKFKYIFLIFTHGEVLVSRCKRIVESLDGKLYAADNDYDVYHAHLEELNNKITDLETVLDHTQERLTIELKEIALEIEKWTILTRKEKSIYSH